MIELLLYDAQPYLSWLLAFGALWGLRTLRFGGVDAADELGGLVLLHALPDRGLRLAARAGATWHVLRGRPVGASSLPPWAVLVAETRLWAAERIDDDDARRDRELRALIVLVELYAPVSLFGAQRQRWSAAAAGRALWFAQRRAILDGDVAAFDGLVERLTGSRGEAARSWLDELGRLAYDTVELLSEDGSRAAVASRRLVDRLHRDPLPWPGAAEQHAGWIEILCRRADWHGAESVALAVIEGRPDPREWAPLSPYLTRIHAALAERANRRAPVTAEHHRTIAARWERQPSVDRALVSAHPRLEVGEAE